MISNGPEDTVAAGMLFASQHIAPGCVVALRGELGAGKTHFVKGIARAFAIDPRELTSPTFALVNEYEARRDLNSFTLFHLDCYRFEKPEELLELGVEDYLYPTNAATVIEWPERIEQLLPKRRFEIEIVALSETTRQIRIAL